MVLDKNMAVAVKPAAEVTAKKKPLTKQRRVVVTGMGVVTPVGHDLDVFYNNLLEGVSGISEIEAFDCAQFPTVGPYQFSDPCSDGSVPDVDSTFYLCIFFFNRELLEKSSLSQQMDGLRQNFLRGQTNLCFICSLQARKHWLMVV